MSQMQKQPTFLSIMYPHTRITSVFQFRGHPLEDKIRSEQTALEAGLILRDIAAHSSLKLKRSILPIDQILSPSYAHAIVDYAKIRETINNSTPGINGIVSILTELYIGSLAFNKERAKKVLADSADYFNSTNPRGETRLDILQDYQELYLISGRYEYVPIYVGDLFDNMAYNEEEDSISAYRFPTLDPPFADEFEYEEDGNIEVVPDNTECELNI